MPLVRAAERSGGGFAADVAYCERGAAGPVVEVVVNIAAYGARGDELGCDLGALELRRA